MKIFSNGLQFSVHKYDLKRPSQMVSIDSKNAYEVELNIFTINPCKIREFA